ncbi:hypothetical protein [Nocardia aurantiaca]|uniref:Mce-associated membrane protein n=1 Tax=Nocardia aurantiaca TaxID=2675850 RepID=A0A6I3L566_9NOCA|nr:hypothetical protein [Nocardia aurantiaca]MTE16468.1 hypothetical protein [Nocardia aurantiaca]
MSQHKDSESGANLEKPATTPVPDTTPDASRADAATISADADATSSGADTAGSAAEPTVVLDKPAEPATAKTPEPASANGRDMRKLGAVALLAVSAVVAAVVGFVWFGDAKDETRAEARDAALTDGRQAAVNLMSINPDDIDGSLANIRSSMTGELLKQQEDGQDQLKQTAQDSKTRIQAAVEGITLTSLNSELDHASAFAVLKITRSWPGGQPATFRQLWTLDMVKVGSTWKAEKAQNLGEPVPLGSGGAQQDARQPTSTQPTPKPGN